MRSFLVALSLTACAPSGELADPDPIDAAAADAEVAGLRSGLTLGAPAYVSAGGTAQLVVSGLSPNEVAYVSYSRAGIGEGECPPEMGGVCYEILPPLADLGSASADANGVARLNVQVPRNAPVGLVVAVQAVAYRGLGGAQTVTSAPVEVEVGRTRTDRFTHFPAAVDLLFVIDDSGSMADEQDRLIDSFESLVPVLDEFGLDYHVGVITTDMRSSDKRGKLQDDASGDRWIEPNSANQAISFSQMAQVGTNGDGDEEAFSAMIASIQDHGNGYNRGFRRSDAQYAVVAISDEDEQSTFVSVSDAADFLYNQETWTDDATFSSIVTPRNGCPTGNDGGDKYLGLTAEVGGATESICAANYAPALLEMASALWTSDPYELARATVDASQITVQVDGVAVDAADWVYDATNNTVRFTRGFAPPSGASVTVQYYW